MTRTNNTLLGGRYKLLKVIGFGGMAEVYLAHDELLDRQVAVKMLREQFLEDKELLEQFRREARSAARLIHPNIINVYDVAAEGDDQYIVMEYVDGITLKEYMSEHKLTLEQALDIGASLAAALETAHEHNIIHCDIKPLNILLDRNLNPKIADFGIAKIVSNQTMVYTNAVMGSVHYISPEQANGGKITAASDIYSLGVVLFEMLTGHVPYNGSTAISVAMMHAERPVPMLSTYLDEVPEGLQEIINKAMAKHPEDRYAKAADFRHDLFVLKLKLFPYSNTANLQANGTVGSRVNPVDGTDEEATVIMTKPKNTFDEDATMIMKPVPSHVEPKRAPWVHEAAETPEVPEPEVEEEPEETGFLAKIKGMLFAKEAAKGGRQVEENNPRRGVKKKRKLTPIGWMVMATACVVVISVIANFIFNSNKAVEIVPNVTNMTVVEAQKTLEGKGFKVELKEADSDKYKPGTVMEQSPKGGEKRKQGSTIYLTISKGAELTNIPDVVGMKQSQAEEALRSAGFKVGNVSKSKSKDSKPGTVLSQSPRSGKAPKGSSIDLVVNESGLTVPSVIGKSQKEAEAILKAAKLNVGSVTTVNSTNVAKGAVVSTSPEAGAAINEGGKVNLSISAGGQEQPKTTYVEFDVPGTKPEQVRIVLNDNNGSVVLLQGTKNGGVRIRQRVEYVGRGTVQFYCSGRLVAERSL